MKLPYLCMLFGSASVVLGHVSYDGNCGGKKGQTCLKSQFGNCCSQYGYCGKTNAYCGIGCQSGFGSCSVVETTVRPTSTRTSLQSTIPSSTLKISSDGKCGGSKGIVCTGSKYGDCCSQYGYCGSTNAYCGIGCKSAFGKCDVAPAHSYSSSLSRTTAPSSTSTASPARTSSPDPQSSSSWSSASRGPSSSSTSLYSTLSSSISPSSSSYSTSSSSSNVPTPSSLVGSSTTTISSSTSASTVAPTTIVSSMSSLSLEASSTTAAPLPVCTLPGGSTCEVFAGDSLTNSCPSANGKCKNRYWARCSQAPAAGAATVLQQLGASVRDGEACAAACDALDTCKGFVFSATGPVGQLCDLYSRVDATSPSWVSTFIKIC